jgi:hypothetical protein
MADHDYQAGLDGFVDDLRRVLRAVGGPSYAKLDHLSAQVVRQRPPGSFSLVTLPSSTTSEILSGQRKQVPKWPWVLTFLTVLQVAAQQGGIDPAVVGTLDEWQRKHEAVLAAGQALPRSARVSRQDQRKALENVTVIDPEPSVDDHTSEPNALLRVFLALIQLGGVPQGRHGRQDVVPEWRELYMTLESGAEAIRTYETEAIPGLLQTEAYAQSIAAHRRPSATADEIAGLVEQRMQRQWLYRYRGQCQLWAIVEEASLHSPWIDAPIMRAQAGYLIDLMDEPNVTFQVVPMGTAGDLTLSEPMTIFRLPGRSLGEVVCLEQRDHALFLHERKDTDHYKQLFDSLKGKASPPDNTWRMLREVRDGV